MPDVDKNKRPKISPVDQVVEITGCPREFAEGAVKHAGEGGVELAITLVLSSMSAHWSSAADLQQKPEPTKMVALVRADLNMGVGKVAAQVAHGALGAVRDASSRGHTKALGDWIDSGEKLVVLSVPDLETLTRMMGEAEELVICNYTVADAVRARARSLLSSLRAPLRPRAVSGPGSRGDHAWCAIAQGRTEVDPGTQTVGCIGPAPEEAINAITGKLSLL